MDDQDHKGQHKARFWRVIGVSLYFFTIAVLVVGVIYLIWSFKLIITERLISTDFSTGAVILNILSLLVEVIGIFYTVMLFKHVGTTSYNAPIGRRAKKATISEYPQVSVLIPIYEAIPAILELTLKSVIDSSYPKEKMNIILGDDTNESFEELPEIRELVSKYNVSYLYDTSNKNFYIRVNKGELYDPSTGTESVYNAFRHILENYDGISSADIDYSNLPTFRSLDLPTQTGWDLGRQVTKTKNSMFYLDELCKQSMVGMFQTRDNKIKLKAFNEDQYEPDLDYPIDDSVETFSDDVNILRDSLKVFKKTPLDQTYNEFFIQYGYNPASKEFDKEITITKSNEDQFPEFYEPSTGSNVIVSDTYL